MDVSALIIFFHLQDSSSPRKAAWPWKVRPEGCPKTSVRNYHFVLRKAPKAGMYHLHYGGNPSLLYSYNVFNYGGVEFWCSDESCFFPVRVEECFCFHVHTDRHRELLTLLQGWNFSTSSPLALPGRNSLLQQWCGTVFLDVVRMCVNSVVSP